MNKKFKILKGERIHYKKNNNEKYVFNKVDKCSFYRTMFLFNINIKLHTPSPPKRD